MKNVGYSKVVLGFLLAVYLFSFFQFDRWGKFIRDGGDSWGYYAYLPALFIHNDLDNLQTTVDVNEIYNKNRRTNPTNDLGIYEANPADNGNFVIKYTIGVATLQLPFFFIGHTVASLSAFPTDGFSDPYMLMIHLSSIFYVFLGLIFLRKVLVKHFEDNVTALTILVVGLATNLFYFTTYNTGMAHAYLFFLYCMLLYATVKWYETKAVRHAVMVGLACGMITLIRPVEIICLIIPILYGISNIHELQQRLTDYIKNYKGYLLAIGVYILCGISQLIYWKIVTGEFFFYSYTHETLDLTNPKIIKGLFQFNNGWLIYTPVMILSLMGLLFLWKKKQFLLSVVLFIGLHIYIIYSWYNPNYSNSFGSRPMVETYALLAIPFAIFSGMLFKKVLTKFLLLLLISFFLFLNIFQTWQTSKGILWPEDARRSYYWASFLKTKLTYEALIVNDLKIGFADTSNLKYVNTIYEQGFEDSLLPQKSSMTTNSGNFAFHMKPDDVLAKIDIFALEPFQLQPGDWLKVTAFFNSRKPMSLRMHGTRFVTRFLRDDASYRKTYFVRVENKLGDPTYSPFWGATNVWDSIYYFIPVTEKINPQSDNLVIYLENDFQNEILVDDIKIEHWIKK
ncbi:MAG: hypothetical protein AAF502_03015 [Bacteroidota bacterium]